MNPNPNNAHANRKYSEWEMTLKCCPCLTCMYLCYPVVTCMQYMPCCQQYKHLQYTEIVTFGCLICVSECCTVQGCCAQYFGCCCLTTEEQAERRRILNHRNANAQQGHVLGSV